MSDTAPAHIKDQSLSDSKILMQQLTAYLRHVHEPQMSELLLGSQIDTFKAQRLLVSLKQCIQTGACKHWCEITNLNLSCLDRIEL